MSTEFGYTPAEFRAIVQSHQALEDSFVTAAVGEGVLERSRLYHDAEMSARLNMTPDEARKYDQLQESEKMLDAPVSELERDDENIAAARGNFAEIVGERVKVLGGWVLENCGYVHVFDSCSLALSRSEIVDTSVKDSDKLILSVSLDKDEFSFEKVRRYYRFVSPGPPKTEALRQQILPQDMLALNDAVSAVAALNP